MVDAALSEILSMSPAQRQGLDPGHQVDRILAQHYLAQGRVDEALKVVQNAVHSNTAPGAAKKNLSQFLIQQGNKDAVEIATAALKNVNDKKDLGPFLRIASIAKAKSTSIETAVQKDVERALILAPWELENRLALAFVRSKLQKDSQ